MKIAKLLALLMVVVMTVTALTACASKNQEANNQPATTASAPAEKTEQASTPEEKELEPITFTMFVAGPGEAPPADNKIVQKIKELTGVTIDFEFLVGDMEQKVGIMIASGDYPDLIGAGQARGRFLNAGSFTALDDYLPKYPNLWKHYEPFVDRLRSVAPDNKVYILDIWSRQYWLNDGEDDFYQADYNGPAFWIQKDVLAWDGYSYPKTLDAFFDLLERYAKANPTIDGQPVLPFEIHSQDWRSFCLKNAPQHLIGGRNEGDVVVKPGTLEVEIYQNKDYAMNYYKKLNEVFKKGLINPETFTRNYDDYLSVISTGRVLAMFDQQWNFQDGEFVLISEGKINRTYVPLGISYSGEAVPYNRVRNEGIIGGNGMGISTKCKDVERALQFMDKLLEEDVHRLLYWGIEGEDYYVENGRMLMTEEQYKQRSDTEWQRANRAVAIWSSLPKKQGHMEDGNAWSPDQQPEIKQEFMSDYDKEFLKASGKGDWIEFFGPVTPLAPYGEAWEINKGPIQDDVDEFLRIQDEQLPGIIMAADDAEFDAKWDAFVEQVAPYGETYGKYMNEEILKLVKLVTGE